MLKDAAMPHAYDARRPPWPPSRVELTYTRPADPHDGGPGMAGLWRISADVPGQSEADPPILAHVGDIDVVIVDPGAVDVRGQAHGLGEAVGPVVDAVLTPGRKAERGRVLVVAKARLEVDWRSFGLGIALVGQAIARLADGCRIAAVRPAPLPGEPWLDDVDVQAPGLREAVLGEVFEQLGFEPHGATGVYVLDPGAQEFTQALACLRDRLLQRELLGCWDPYTGSGAMHE
jgi:hypothetical protein